MAYVTYQQLEDRLGVPATRQALDEVGNNDDGDIQQAFTRAAATAQLMVDGPLAAIYAVPFDQNAQPDGTFYVPPYCVNAALTFLCEMLQQKRLVPGELNDYKKAADQYRQELQTIRENGTGLDQKVDRALSPVGVVLEPSLLTANSWCWPNSNTCTTSPNCAPSPLVPPFCVPSPPNSM